MSRRVSPHKVLRALLIVIFSFFAIGQIRGYLKQKKETTNEVIKSLKIREENFYTTNDTKKDLTNLGKEVAKIEATEEAKLKEEAEVAKKAEEANKTNTESLQNTEVATTNTESTNEVPKVETPKVPEVKPVVNVENNKKVETKQVVAEKKQEKKVEQPKVQPKQQQVKQEVKKENTSKQPKKYIHAATVRTEAAARKEVARLGAGYRVQVVRGSSGKNLYQIVSVSTNDPKALSNYEAQARRAGTKYIVKSTK